MTDQMAWDCAWKFWLSWEGSKVHTTPGDPGGTTRYGIAQRFNPHVDVALLTADEARRILYDSYWLPNACQRVAEAGAPLTAWALFDFAGNASALAARKGLQHCLGVKTDGALGKLTMQALSRVLAQPSPESADAILAYRLTDYRIDRELSDGDDGRFDVGLVSRCSDLCFRLGLTAGRLKPAA